MLLASCIQDISVNMDKFLEEFGELSIDKKVCEAHFI